jgi:DNA-binding CsgD family transcriptional regulator
VLVLASLVTADLYRATTDGLILAVTGLVAHAIAGLLHRPAAPGASPVPAVSANAAATLSAREAEVLSELVNGARNSDIAATLGISERTVKAHLGSIYQKLGVDSRSAAVAAAVGRKLVLVLALVGLTGAVPQPPPPDRVVTITIDDLPAVAVSGASEWPKVTQQLLATLRRHHVPAVGFVNEGKLYVNGALDSNRVALLQSWLDAGEELGNHTFAHRGAHATPLAEYLAGITRGEQVTRALARRAGRPFRYFRHPQLHAGRSLAYRGGVERFLAAHGYTIAPVTVDNQEWVYARAYIVADARGDSALKQRVVADYFRHLDSAFAYSEQLSRLLFDREIPLVLLLHANQINADHLEAILSRLEARGYRFAPLERVLADSAYRSRDTYVGATGPSWLIRWASTRGIAIPAEPREEPWIAELATQGP